MIELKRGKVLTEGLSYKLKASQSFKKGDFIRLNNAGEIADAKASGLGMVHGIALSSASDHSTGDIVPVAMITGHTVIAVTIDTAVTVSVSHALATVTGGLTKTAAATALSAVVVGLPTQDSVSGDPDLNTDGTDKVAYVSFTQASLDARIA